LRQSFLGESDMLTKIVDAAIFLGLYRTFFRLNMYAIIRSGGKQFRAEPGKTIRVPSLAGEPGDKVTFDDVLVAATDDGLQIGTPSVSGAAVTGEVVRHGKDKKIIIFKWKRRKNYRRKAGHRQDFTEVRISDIRLGR
jgi:large subunit ribosomal protein L21